LEDWVASGEPYAGYRDVPLIPWFIKRFEVHVPVLPAARAGVTPAAS
jgi:hypothetical protein